MWSYTDSEVLQVTYTTYKVQKQCNNGQQAEVKFKTKYNTTMKTPFPPTFYALFI